MKNRYSYLAWSIFILVVFFMSFMFYLIWQGERAYGYKTAHQVIKAGASNGLNTVLMNNSQK